MVPIGRAVTLKDYICIIFFAFCVIIPSHEAKEFLNENHFLICRNKCASASILRNFCFTATPIKTKYNVIAHTLGEEISGGVVMSPKRSS